ncbi:MAG: hypothetical protein ACRD3W_25215 [Terriglobales bacterium]
MAARKLTEEAAVTGGPTSKKVEAQAIVDVLQARFQALHDLATRQHLFGGADRQRMYDIQERLRRFLHPEDPAILLRDVDAVLKIYVLSGDAPYWLDPGVVESLRESIG